MMNPEFDSKGGDGNRFAWLPWLLLLGVTVLLVRAWRPAADELPARPADVAEPRVTGFRGENEPMGIASRRTNRRCNSWTHRWADRPSRLVRRDNWTRTNSPPSDCSKGTPVPSSTSRPRRSARIASRLSVTEMPQGAGSGFVWDRQGHIVTNFHVIEDADRANVIFRDQSKYPAALVGVEPSKDVAVLKIDIDESQLNPIAIGQLPTNLRVGQNVYAIGNPFGFDQTLTTGIISGLGTHDSRLERPQDRRCHSDGRGHQSRQFGRSTAGQRGESHRRQYGHLQSVGRLRRHRLRHSSRHGGADRAAIDSVRQRSFAPGWASLPWMHAMCVDLEIDGVLVLEVEPGSTAEKAGIRPTVVKGDEISLGDLIIGVDDERITVAGRPAGCSGSTQDRGPREDCGLLAADWQAG